MVRQVGDDQDPGDVDAHAGESMKRHPMADASKSSMGILVPDHAPMKIMMLEKRAKRYVKRQLD